MSAHVRAQTKADLEAEGKEYNAHPSEAVLDKMIELGRPGRAGGGGFYDYNGRNKQLWSGLADIFLDGQEQLPQEEMMNCFMKEAFEFLSQKMKP